MRRYLAVDRHLRLTEISGLNERKATEWKWLCSLQFHIGVPPPGTTQHDTSYRIRFEWVAYRIMACVDGNTAMRIALSSK